MAEIQTDYDEAVGNDIERIEPLDLDKKQLDIQHIMLAIATVSIAIRQFTLYLYTTKYLLHYVMYVI